jgi:hypothetical protein
MLDQELIKKIQSLKEVKPESAWKQETRDVLLAQVSNSVSEEVKVSFFDLAVYNFKNAFSFLPNTAWAVMGLVFILAGSAMGTLGAENSKPGDTLYVAKALKEKIQLALTFNQEDKARLDMKLASIHAMEITEVLSSPSFNATANPKKAEQLAQNFQQEINTVKQSYSVINNINDKKSPTAIPAVSNTSSLAVNSDDVKVGVGDMQKATDSKVYTVESGKDTKGIQIYIPKDKNKISAGSAVASSAVEGSLNASTTSDSALTASSSVDSAVSINTSLDKAAASFNTKDFSQAKDILTQVGKIIDNISSGSVKGVTEAGTSTVGADAAVGSSSGK